MAKIFEPLSEPKSRTCSTTERSGVLQGTTQGLAQGINLVGFLKETGCGESYDVFLHQLFVETA